jgi:hypothetical protein
MRLRSSERYTRSVWLSLFLLSAATLTFEINLTRLFSVAQFYHFAFMIVSIAPAGTNSWRGTFRVACITSSFLMPPPFSVPGATPSEHWHPWFKG